MHALVLPGMDGSGELLPEFLAALRPEFDASTIRYPGDAAMDYAALADWVAPVLRSRSPGLLVAESFSGPVGILLAARHPDAVRGLVLCATFASTPRPWLSPLRGLLQWPLPIPPSRMLMPAMMGRWATTEWTRRQRASLKPLSAATLRQRLHAVLCVDVTRQLDDIRCPVLYLQARHDRLVPAANWTTIQARLPDAGYRQFDAPHFLLQSHPQQAALAIKEHFH